MVLLTERRRSTLLILFFTILQIMKIRTCSLPSARWAILACSLSFLSACGGGGGGSSDSASSTGSTPTNTSGNQASSTSSSKASSSAQNSSGSSTGSSALYVTAPVVSSCTPGVVTDSVKTAVLDKLNSLRKRHGLPAVAYDSSDDNAAAAAALYMVANNGLTHTPSTTGKCYTSEASRLAGISNLHMAWTSGGDTRSMASTDAIMGYANDKDVDSLGHRRWVLYPFLAKTTFGRADGDSASGTLGRMASSLRTIGGAASSVTMSNDFVAFPYGSYSVSEFTPGWYLSFSVVASKTSINANGGSNVNLDSAAITVKDGSGNSLAVSSQSANYEGYGLPNSLQWKVAGLAAGGSYTVTISNVTVNSVARTFTYTFQLTN